MISYCNSVVAVKEPHSKALASLPVPPERDLAGALHEVSNALTVVLGWLDNALEACAPDAAAGADGAARQAIEIARSHASLGHAIARRAVGAPVTEGGELRSALTLVHDTVTGVLPIADRRGISIDIDDDVAEALYSANRSVPTYTKSQITPLKNNYNGATPDPAYIPGWRLTLGGLSSGLAVSLDIEGEGRFQRLIFRSNLDEIVAAGAEHPLRVETAEDGTPAPYILIRPGLEARLARPVFYELADLGAEETIDGETKFGVWSEGVFFELGDPGDET